MLLQADAATIPLEDKSIHCAIFSPPYWGLRKYSGDQSLGMFPDLGLEKTPEEHIERMVVILREVRRVLRDDGVCWLNYGDCYSAAGWESNRRNVIGEGSFDPADRKSGKDPGNKAGSLMLMPHRLAIALQDDGWIIRNDVVWYKRNPMPESVSGWRWEAGKTCECQRENNEAYLAEKMAESGLERDSIPRHFPGADQDCSKCHGTGKMGEPVLKKSSWRHTRAHEYIFQLVKRMNYFCNQEAVRERQQSFDEYHEGRSGGRDGYPTKRGFEKRSLHPSGRNPRSVMDVPTAPYKGQHFATFPPKLIAPLIRASCPRRACPECGQAWAAVVERDTKLTKTESARYDEWNYGKLDDYSAGEQVKAGKAANLRYTGFIPGHFKKQGVTGYRPTCECGHEEYKPGIVLDIFVGSGTVPMVAKELQRRWVGMDISYPYLDEQARYRSKWGKQKTKVDDLPLFQNDALQDVEIES